MGQYATVAAQVPDDFRFAVKAPSVVNDALVRLTQEKMFSILMEMNVDPDAVDLPKLARAVAELGKASVAQKRWQAEARKQALEEAAARVDTAAQARGLNADEARFWREQVLMGM